MQANDQFLQLQTLMYTFSHSGLVKYDQEVYEAVMDMFDQLPLAALVNNNFLCIHGGISRDV